MAFTVRLKAGEPLGCWASSQSLASGLNAWTLMFLKKRNPYDAQPIVTPCLFKNNPQTRSPCNPDERKTLGLLPERRHFVAPNE